MLESSMYMTMLVCRMVVGLYAGGVHSVSRCSAGAGDVNSGSAEWPYPLR
jgi:hypothetical protein